MTFFAAFITFKVANLIDPKLSYLSASIVLLDPPSTIFSLMLLTDTIFLSLMSLFILTFIIYLKTEKKYFLILSALLLAVAVYFRPIGYYLGIGVTLFIIYSLFKNQPLERRSLWLRRKQLKREVSTQDNLS